jgi:hypothetical protein
MNEDLAGRIERIYSAIKATEELDLSRVPGRVVHQGKFIGVFQDFRGGLSEADLSNLLHTVIHNIANLKDHMKRWCRQNGWDASIVDTRFESSLSLKLVQDLSNLDKHGPERDGGHSKRSPRLAEINRVLRMTVAPMSSMALTLDANAKPVVRGSGKASVVIIADVVDEHGEKLGELEDIANEAVAEWESILATLGVSG